MFILLLPRPTALVGDALVFFLEIITYEGHLNFYTGLRDTAILMNGWILPIGGIALGRVCGAAGLLR